MIRGGLARFHALSCRELETEANLVAERFVKRWCQERRVPLESVNVLVVSDLCRSLLHEAADYSAGIMAKLTYPAPPNVQSSPQK